MNKKITIPLSEEDLEELKRGKTFDWTFNNIDVHLVGGVEEEESIKMKKYQCYWDERHSVIVEAENEEDAKEQVNLCNFYGQESATMNGSVDVQELKVGENK